MVCSHEMLEAVSGRKGEVGVLCCSCGASSSLGQPAALMCEVQYLPGRWQPSATSPGSLCLASKQL